MQYILKAISLKMSRAHLGKSGIMSGNLFIMLLPINIAPIDSTYQAVFPNLK